MGRVPVGVVSSVTVAVIWGLSFVAARVVLLTITPVLLATVRFIIASLVFGPVMVEELRRGRFPKPRDLTELALLGFLSISIYFWLQYTGVKYAGAGVSALLVVGLIPIITGIMSAFVLGEKYGVQRMLGTGLGLSGVALIVVPRLLLDRIDWWFYLGVLCLLLNAVCWAIYSTLSRRLMSRVGRPLAVTSYVTVLGTLLLIPLSLTSDWSLIGYLQPEQWLSVLYLSLVCSCLGYFLWNFSLSKMDAVRAAAWLYLEPLVAFVGEALIFGGVPSSTTLVGGGAIIAGVLFTNWSRATASRRDEVE